MRTAVAAITICAMMFLPAEGTALGQSAGQDQRRMFMAELGRLQAQAKNAFEREMERGKADAFRNADNTRALVECLGNEIGAATANYTAFTGAIRSIISLEGPDTKDIKMKRRSKR